ncbi:MAG: site-2 protease family protein, partial [Gemmataceae bacterium]|nr:site-2 protease family protein [Gemmataceae bacterium]
MDSRETSPQPDMNPQRDPNEPIPAAEEREPTLGEWLRSNGPTLVILLGLFVWLYIKFDADGLWAIAKAALGLGLVIFVHELGHFLVAKWCNVHVTTFSIGFGPAIPGCRWKWGETTYKIAVFPLGGYVQMVGQVDGDESTDEAAVEDPRSYRNKSVGQRMAIISAGVVMNVILAIICFIVVFQGPGKDRKAAVVASTDSGGPAGHFGIPSGSVITRIGNVENPFFEDLMVEVMSTTSGEKVRVVYLPPGAKAPVSIEMEPRKTSDDDRPMLGLRPPESLQLQQERFLRKEFKTPAYFGSAASQASPPFAFGDVIVAMTDPKTGEVTTLRDDPRKPGNDQRDYFEFLSRLRLLAGQEIVIRVQRGDNKETVDIKVPPAYHTTLGARMQMGQVTAVRKDSPGSKVGLQLPTVKHFPNGQPISFDGDVIERVEVREPDGSFTRFTNEPVRRFLGVPLPGYKPLDPVRLPSQLRAWARRMEGKEREVVLTVRRHDQQNAAQQFVTRTLTLTWDATYEDNSELPMSLNSPLSIPGLGIAYQIKTTVAAVDDPNGSLQPGDVIKRYRFEAVVNCDGEKERGSWVKVGPEQWARVSWILQSPGITSVDLEVERNGKTQEVSITPREVKDWPMEERGLILMPDQRRQKADGILDAILLGLKDTRNSMVQVIQNLRGMITGRISVENLGGPITIGRVAYYFAGLDFWEFVFFLGLISVNLAVINFLPIPVLDGGHMVFLLYEKIRGKPASEGVRVGATYAGLLLLASLMIFVLFLDIKR